MYRLDGKMTSAEKKEWWDKHSLFLYIHSIHCRTTSRASCIVCHCNSTCAYLFDEGVGILCYDGKWDPLRVNACMHFHAPLGTSIAFSCRRRLASNFHRSSFENSHPRLIITIIIVISRNELAEKGLGAVWKFELNSVCHPFASSVLTCAESPFVYLFKLNGKVCGFREIAFIEKMNEALLLMNC